MSHSRQNKPLRIEFALLILGLLSPLLFLSPSSAQTGTPAATPASQAFQPSAPYHATFFYIWYKNPNTDDTWSYWTDGSNTPPNSWFSHYIPNPYPDVFDPATELYSSNNYEI